MAIQSVSGVGSSRGLSQQAVQGTQGENLTFEQAMKELDAYLESQRKTVAEKRQEEQALQEKKAKAKKMAELQGRISTLRTRVNMGHEGAERELSAVQNELFLLMLFG
ncbi:MAG: hypothetical protein GXY32_05555 [Ruminococcaceae bacterium]|nr:hypothetical protein [Oscillospiraceae bacterium]